MTQDPYDGYNPEQIQNDEDARREYIRQTFGDDALEGLATDTPWTSRRPSSAQRHVQDRDKALHDLHREERVRKLAILAAQRADREAFDRVTADPNQASDQDQRAALRHAQRHGLVPHEPTPHKLIRQGERARRLAGS
jgi:hypothetical protein